MELFKKHANLLFLFFGLAGTFLFFVIISGLYAQELCTYVYSDWSVCSTNGIKYRTVLSTSPSGCYQSPGPVLSATCTPCTYTYGDWGACGTDGKRYRTLSSRSPENCYQYPAPVLHEYCTPCTYTYGDWGLCSSSGIQTREVFRSPTGCYDATQPVSQQPCSYSPNTTLCTYTYGTWSACNDAGFETRTVIKSPTGCYEYPLPITTQSCNSAGTISNACTYTYGDWSACNDNGVKQRTVLSTSPSTCSDESGPILHEECISCAYAYSEWGACGADGKRYRKVSSMSPSNCYQYPAPVLYESCPPCTYTYGDWSTCNSSGLQTREVFRSPAVCYDATQPDIHQRVCPNVISCVYDYSAWSACSIEGKQLRTLLSKSPSACYETTAPVLSQPCNYLGTPTPTPTLITPTPTPSPTATLATPSIAPCVYTYSAWSTCGADGWQTRTVSSKSPSGCHETTAPVLRKTCLFSLTPSPSPSAAISCFYTYSDWTACDASGRRTRSVISRSPAGCVVNTPPVLEAACASEPVQAAVVTMPCSYVYGDWSPCSFSGVQTRAVKLSPAGCYESSRPQLIQICQYQPPPATEPNFEILKASPPPPAPESLVVVSVPPAITPPPNFNDRTSVQWQEFYFWSGNCADVNTCGGNADADKDGLTNNDEYRYGTNPRSIDTDKDGYPDAFEIQNGHNPLVAPSVQVPDRIIFEDASVKEAGQVAKEVYQVNKAEAVLVSSQRDGQKQYLRISGKALPNIFVVVYIYSDPIVLTIKTDENGNWSYVLDNPIDDGEHQVYVAVTDNAGKITAKSEALTFLKTAEAISVVPSAEAASLERAAPPSKNWLRGDYLIFIGLALMAVALALAAVGLIKYSYGGGDDQVGNPPTGSN